MSNFKDQKFLQDCLTNSAYLAICKDVGTHQNFLCMSELSMEDAQSLLHRAMVTLYQLESDTSPPAWQTPLDQTLPLVKRKTHEDC